MSELFEAALDCQGAELSAFLDRACGTDQLLRSDVERLLAAHEQDAGFLEHPAFDWESILERAGVSEDIVGRRIGRYSIRALIGKGGMGAVYRAVREDDFQMEVAIKLLNRGTDTEAALARFRFERQVLAGLQHPNIARLFDGGATADGLPYLVMEYVDGTPLLEYAAPLSVRARLELFRSVCCAVQYAHDKKVIHRDIKPANILVTSAGLPKLLDFGIATLLDPEGETAVTVTSTGARLMTPRYASPEQVRGEPLTPATDIYSLGLVLFELLTGGRAHAGSDEVLDQDICASDANKPSAAAKDIPRDLDNVVLKALRKEPERRYASAAELSDDLDRFLRDLPVKAHEKSAAYSTLKFVKRKRALLTAVTVTAVVATVVVAAVARFGVSSGAGRTSAAHKNLGWAFKKVAALGEPAPGGSVYTKYFQPWALNDRGDVTFVSQVAAGGDALFLWKKGASSPVPLVLPGAPAPGGGVFEGYGQGYASLNEAGDVAFVYGLRPLEPPELKGFQNGGVYHYSHTDGKLSAVVVPGVTPAPGFGTAFLSANQHATLNNSGQIVFSGVVPTRAGLHPEDGIGQGTFLVDRNRVIHGVIVPGDPAPGGSRFDYTYNPWINDTGDISFEAHLAGEECVEDLLDRQRCGGSLYLKRRGTGLVTSIAHQGDQGPLAVRLNLAWGGVMNNAADLVFIGEHQSTPRVRRPSGIYLHSRGVNSPVALPTDVMPDRRKVLTINPARVIGNYFVNNRGDISFIAALENNESALYVRSQGDTHLVAGTGTVIPDIGTIASVTNFQVNGGILNQGGQVLFWAMTTDDKGILLIATPQP